MENKNPSTYDRCIQLGEAFFPPSLCVLFSQALEQGNFLHWGGKICWILKRSGETDVWFTFDALGYSRVKIWVYSNSASTLYCLESFFVGG